MDCFSPIIYLAYLCNAGGGVLKEADNLKAEEGARKHSYIGKKITLMERALGFLKAEYIRKIKIRVSRFARC